MQDENDSSEKLDDRPLSREEMHEALRRVHERAAAAADAAIEKRAAEKAAAKQRDLDRRADLKRQADELLGAEGKSEP